MLQFKQSDTSAKIILTLTESVTISEPYFLFVFTHVLTKEVVKFIKSSPSDESNFQARYNQFDINPSVLFLDKPIGEWHYKVYEQLSSTSTDESGLNALEYGKMILDRATEFSFKKYNGTTSFKAYNG